MKLPLDVHPQALAKCRALAECLDAHYFPFLNRCVIALTGRTAPPTFDSGPGDSAKAMARSWGGSPTTDVAHDVIGYASACQALVSCGLVSRATLSPSHTHTHTQATALVAQAVTAHAHALSHPQAPAASPAPAGSAPAPAPAPALTAVPVLTVADLTVVDVVGISSVLHADALVEDAQGSGEGHRMLQADLLLTGAAGASTRPAPHSADNGPPASPALTSATVAPSPRAASAGDQPEDAAAPSSLVSQAVAAAGSPVVHAAADAVAASVRSPSPDNSHHFGIDDEDEGDEAQE